MLGVVLALEVTPEQLQKRARRKLVPQTSAPSSSGRRPVCTAQTLKALVKQMVSLLSAKDAKGLRNQWKGVGILLGSFCSGTDICAEVLAAICEWTGIGLRHKFSCDSAPHSQRWIQTQCQPCPDLIYDNVIDIAQGRGYDVLSGTTKPVPPSDFLYVGFSCKDVSHLNKASHTARACVRAKSHRIGQTLACSVEYIMRFQPYFVFLENVAALDDQDENGVSNADEVVDIFASIGYFMVYVVLDARQHGSAQRRTRWWGCGVRVKEGPLDQEDMDELEPKRQHMLQVLEDLQMQPISLDKVLLPEGSPELEGWQDWAASAATVHVDDVDNDDDIEDQHVAVDMRPELEPTTGRRGDAAGWPELHAEQFRLSGFRYPVFLELLYSAPELRKLETLTPRAREVAAFFDKKFGRVTGEDEATVDVSQSLHRAPQVFGGVPCTTPRGLQWLRNRMRRVEPIESLAMQGITGRSLADVAHLFTLAELQGLAGNAFNGNIAMAMSLAAMVAFGPPSI